LGGTWPKPGDTSPGKIQRPDIACPETDLFCLVFSRFWSGVCWGKINTPDEACPGTDLFFLGFFFWGLVQLLLKIFLFFFLWRWQGDISI
jgi:hypothetical protein